MKLLLAIKALINRPSARTDVRRYQSGSVLTAVLLTCAVLAGPGGSFNASAQSGTVSCPPGSEPNGTLSPTDNGASGYGTFPGNGATAGPTYDTTASMGVFQINVDPAYASLFTGGGYTTYLGYSPSAGTLTSPVVYDRTTTIGRSATKTANPFPTTIQVGSAPYLDNVTAYPPSTPLVPFLLAGTGTKEVFTEVDKFTLSTQAGSNYCGCTTPNQTPCMPVSAPSYNMVMAGQFNPDVTALGLPALPPSYGLVQSQANGEVSQGYAIAAGAAGYDFPANSMFDIFVCVDLPQLAGYSVSPPFLAQSAFPTQGLLLYSDQTQPLVVQDVPPDYDNSSTTGAQNLALCGFPPGVIYLHGGNTIAPTVYFAQDNPGYWHKGDPFGSLVLAGHGTFKPCDPESNLVTSVLGPTNAANQPMPIGYIFPPAGNTTFPPHPGLSYLSQPGVNLGGQVIDEVAFNTNLFYLTELSIAALTNTVLLPSAGNTTNYTNVNTTASCQVSLNNTTFYSATGTGTVVIQVSNPNGVLNNATSYNMKVTQMSLTLSVPGLGFNVYLRQSTSSNSIGTHIVQSSSQGGPIIASFVKQALQLSTDQLLWYDANRTLYMELGSAPCGRAGAKLHVANAPNGDVVISWADSHYTLEGSQSLVPTSWTPIAGTSPITNTAASKYTYYKLECH